MAVTVFYAVELRDLERWVGARDERWLGEVRDFFRDEEEGEEWEPEEHQLLERLLDRMANEGKLYEGLAPEERYYLTQLLIDLFDEYVDSEAVTDEIPHERLVAALDDLRRREPALESLCRAFAQGRTLGSDEPLWPRDQDIDDVLPFFGFQRHAELAPLLPALERSLAAGSGTRARGKAGGDSILRSLPGAIRLAVETERDLLSFTG
jgi:hypothetical protein